MLTQTIIVIVIASLAILLAAIVISRLLSKADSRVEHFYEEFRQFIDRQETLAELETAKNEQTLEEPDELQEGDGESVQPKVPEIPVEEVDIDVQYPYVDEEGAPNFLNMKMSQAVLLELKFSKLRTYKGLKSVDYVPTLRDLVETSRELGITIPSVVNRVHRNEQVADLLKLEFADKWATNKHGEDRLVSDFTGLKAHNLTAKYITEYGIKQIRFANIVLLDSYMAKFPDCGLTPPTLEQFDDWYAVAVSEITSYYPVN